MCEAEWQEGERETDWRWSDIFRRQLLHASVESLSFCTTAMYGGIVLRKPAVARPLSSSRLNCMTPLACSLLRVSPSLVQMPKTRLDYGTMFVSLYLRPCSSARRVIYGQGIVS